MSQHVTQDEVAVRYSDALDHVRGTWMEHAAHAERLLVATSWRCELDADELAAQLRRVQYQAHVASELTAGLVPPPSSIDDHVRLIATLTLCRDTFSVLAVRCDIDEFDDDAAQVGAQVLSSVVEDFHNARTSSALVGAWRSHERFDIEQAMLDGAESPMRRWWSTLVWMTIAAGAGLLGSEAVHLMID